jgi:deoxycytidylate deaminase
MGRSTALGNYSKYKPLPSIHAEHDCIRKYSKMKKETSKKLKMYTLVVFKLDKEGNYKNSRPCQHCIETMKKFGINKVIYSNEYGGLSVEHIKTMDESSAFVSLGWKRIKKLVPWEKKYA